MNTKEDIVKMIYEQRVFHDVCETYCKDRYLLDELVQTCTLVLLEKDETLIVGLNERGELVKYIARIAKNQFCSTTSPFYKTYRKQQIKEKEIDEQRI